MQHALPAGFSVRRPTMDDVPTVCALLQAREIAERGRARITEEALRNRWEVPEHDLSKDNWLVTAPGGRVIATVGIGHWEPTHLFSNLNIHPDYAEPELYPYAIELVLERAYELVAVARVDARVTLNFDCSAKDIAGQQALKHAGFTYVRSNLLMQIDLHDRPPMPIWPEGVELRPYTPDMLRQVFEADNEAFQDHWGHVPMSFELWQTLMVKRPQHDPSLWFLACEDGEIAGIALCMKKGEEAWVDSLAVRRPWRRKGLGLALLHHAFGEFYHRGERQVVLMVDSQNLTGATRLYTRAGMRPVEQHDTFQLELRPGVELSTQTLDM